MATATAVRGKDGNVVPVTNIDEHKQEIATLRAAQEARRDFMLDLTDPEYARELELKKPIYRWEVRFELIERKQKSGDGDLDPDDVIGEEAIHGSPRGFKRTPVKRVVVAQSESDAWAKCCDALKIWPSPKTARPQFKRLKQVNQ